MSPCSLPADDENKVPTLQQHIEGIHTANSGEYHRSERFYYNITHLCIQSTPSAVLLYRSSTCHAILRHLDGLSKLVDFSPEGDDTDLEGNTFSVESFPRTFRSLSAPSLLWRGFTCEIPSTGVWYLMPPTAVSYDTWYKYGCRVGVEKRTHMIPGEGKSGMNPVRPP